MVELIVFKAKASTPEELEMVRQALNGLFGDSVTEPVTKRAMTPAERAKKYRDNKKQKEMENVTVRDEESKEEREEKEGVLPLSSPSFLPSSPLIPPINYPITPYNPPLPEEKGEREESVLAVGSEKQSEQHRRVTVPYGKNVFLTAEEYGKLCDKFGKEQADKMIEKMDDYIGEDPKRIAKYKPRNHYLTLLNWSRMDESRKTTPVTNRPAPPQAKRTYSATEVVEMMERGEL